MITLINKRLRDERGFTLIELMVVVLIIAILIAIAIPTFLGARRRAQDRQAQSNLRNALTSEKTFYADFQAFTDDDSLTGPLAEIESNLAWGSSDGGARGADVEAVGAGGAGPPLTYQGVVIRSVSRSGTQFCIMDLAQTVTTAFYGQTNAGTYYHVVEDVDDPAVPVACPTTGWETTTVGWQY